MYRKLASALLVASAISSQYAVAVSLGEITMHSALNEPLKAEIKLSNAEGLDVNQLAIRLASPDEFEQAGIERTFFHSDINFEVRLDGKGAGVVYLSSKRLLNEPFLDVLLESKWPTGRMLRSYTVLVDLPVYKEPQAITVDAPKAATPKTEVSTAKPTRIAPPARTLIGETEQTPKAGGEYRTQRNDTLWVLAERISAGEGISINQAMLSIQEHNKHAFINGNINRLKAGVVLRLPTAEEMRSVSAQTAQQLVSQHNQQWRNAQLDGTETVGVAQRPTASTGQGTLRLTSAGTGTAAGSSADAADTQDIAAMRDEIAATSLENKELSGKVDSLNSQVEQLERLIELKNAELARLQEQLGKEVKKPAKATDTTEGAQQEDVQAEAEAADSTEVAAVVDKTTDKEAKEAPKAEQKPAVVEPPKPAQPEPSIIDKISQNPIYIGIIGLLIAIGVGGFLLRRRAQAEKQLLEENESFSFDDVDNVALYAEGDDEDGEEQVEAMQDEEATEAEAEQIAEDDADSTVLQTGDAIGEADIYVAYGRYDQAAALLRTAIAQSPNNAALRSKLLEVYLAADDKEGFQQTYLELQERGEHDAVAKAKELLSTTDTAADWLADLPESTGDDAAASLDSLDDDLESLDDAFDFDASLDEGLEEDLLADGFATDVDEAFDLDLGDEDTLEDDLSGDLSGFSTDLTEDDDFSLDLDSDTSVEISSTEDSIDEFGLASDELDLSESFSFDDTESDTASIVDDLGELSLESELGDGSSELDDLSDDFSSFDLDSAVIDKVDESTSDDKLGDDALSFDDLDLAAESLSLDDLSVDTDTLEETVETEDVLSLDDLDFSATESAVDTSLETEEAELSLDDFDLDFDDLGFDTDTSELSDTAEPAAEDEVALDLDLGVEDDTAVDAIAAAQSIDPEPSAPVADEPTHVSASIDSLEDDAFSFVDSADEVATKLDLAQAYVDMGDVDGAREILLEVLREGNDDQRSEANVLMSTLD